MSSVDLPGIVAGLLGEAGDRQLVSLTREELKAVGDDPLLANAADDLWWQELTEREQELVIETAQRGLVARNLLVPDADGELVATGEVQAILGARTAPAQVVVLSDPAVRFEDGSSLQVAMLSLPVERGSAYAVLIAAWVEGVYLHRLVAASLAASVAVDWLMRPADAAPVESELEVGRTVEVLTPTDGEPTHQRLLVLGQSGSWATARVVDGTPEAPEPTAAETLRGAISALSGWAQGDTPAP